MSTPVTKARKEFFTDSGDHRALQRGPIRVPLGATHVVCDGEGESDGEAQKVDSPKHLKVDPEKCRLKVPLFTDPDRVVRRRNI